MDQCFINGRPYFHTILDESISGQSIHARSAEKVNTQQQQYSKI